MQKTPSVEISRLLNCIESNFLRHNSTCVAENRAEKSLALGFIPIFVRIVITSSIVKYLLCESPLEWLFHHDSSSLLSVQNSLETILRPWKERNCEPEGLCWCVMSAVPTAAVLHWNSSGLFWPIKSFQRRYPGSGVFFNPFYRNVTNHVLMATEGIKSFSLVAIIFVEFVTWSGV